MNEEKGYEELASGNSDPKFFVLPDIASELSAVENEPLTDEEKAQKKDELMQNYAVKLLVLVFLRLVVNVSLSIN